MLFLACVGPAPKEDSVLAYASIEAAKAAQAQRFAPGFYAQAEEHYRQAFVDYEERRYREAREHFIQSRQFAEKAENYTILKRAETGDGE
ncbi:MAG: hypothetical protein A2Z20_05670 [Bdellovibrionales bacterium RBG_16_40_8]|nr:MAG: hypothetical protein A2Z20_05670 [Bdellovibrionales bacterium RBG_16_40_8]